MKSVYSNQNVSAVANAQCQPPQEGVAINIRVDAVCSRRTEACCLNPGTDDMNTNCNFTCCLIWV